MGIHQTNFHLSFQAHANPGYTFTQTRAYLPTISFQQNSAATAFYFANADACSTIRAEPASKLIFKLQSGYYVFFTAYAGSAVVKRTSDPSGRQLARRSPRLSEVSHYLATPARSYVMPLTDIALSRAESKFHPQDNVQENITTG